MKIVAIVDTEDCGPFVVLDEDIISVIKCSDFYIAATTCAFTGRALTAEISHECATQLIENGVNCLDFNDEISGKEEVRDKKKTD
jgi:hypothetical protein